MNTFTLKKQNTRMYNVLGTGRNVYLYENELSNENLSFDIIKCQIFKPYHSVH